MLLANRDGFVTVAAQRALCFTALQSGLSVKLVSRGEPQSDQPVYNTTDRYHSLPELHLEYSRDCVTWRPFVDEASHERITPNTYGEYSSVEVALPDAGDRVYIRASRPGLCNSCTCSYQGTQAFWIFRFSGRVAASGDVTTLLDRDGDVDEIPVSFAFGCLFRDCTQLVSAPRLPSATLKASCYLDMFRGCTSLAEAPELPAVTLAGNCYQRMFYGCTALAHSPDLPEATLAASCFLQTFFGCTALTAPPALPAKTLAAGCYYQMFRECTSLVEAPELPAGTLVSNCYFEMFINCSRLAYVKTAQTSFTGCSNWLLRTAASGTFEYLSESLPVPDAGDGSASTVPSGWVSRRVYSGGQGDPS